VGSSIFWFGVRREGGIGVSLSDEVFEEAEGGEEEGGRGLMPKHKSMSRKSDEKKLKRARRKKKRRK
jgi:hypothetical protein